MKIALICLIILATAFGVMPGWKLAQVDGGSYRDCGGGENGGGSIVPANPQYPSSAIDWVQGYPAEWLRYYRTCFPPLGQTSFDVGDGTTRTVDVHWECPPTSCCNDFAHYLGYRWGWTIETRGWCVTEYTWKGTNAEYEIYFCPACPN